MSETLSLEEERFVEELLKRHADNSAAYRLLPLVFLIAGCALVVHGVYFTVGDLGDRSALLILLPSAVMALVCFVASFAAERWYRRVRLLADVLGKLWPGIADDSPKKARFVGR